MISACENYVGTDLAMMSVAMCERSDRLSIILYWLENCMVYLSKQCLHCVSLNYKFIESLLYYVILRYNLKQLVLNSQTQICCSLRANVIFVRSRYISINNIIKTNIIELIVSSNKTLSHQS